MGGMEVSVGGMEVSVGGTAPTNVGSTEPNVGSTEHIKQKTASKLAYIFTFFLAGALLLHYILLSKAICHGCDSAIKAFQDLFHVWFPAVIGIVSSVTTYYFTRENNGV